MTFDKFHNRKMHLIFKEPPSFYSSTITRYLEVFDSEFNVICVKFDKTYFKEQANFNFS